MKETEEIKPVIHQSSKFPCIIGRLDNHAFFYVPKNERNFKWNGCALWKCEHCGAWVESM